MENNNELVTDVTENVEQTTEEIVESVETTEEVVETPKTYTEDELNARVDELLAKKIARKEARIRKEYDKKYGRLESVLKAGTGEESIDDITNTFTNFYAKKGIEIPSEPTYSDNDMKVLANAEADSIISLGYEDVVEEVDRLAELGVDNMTPREKLVFTKLAEYRKSEQDRKELAKIGVSAKALEDKDFIEFADKLNPSMSMKDKYEMYDKYRPKPKVETMGSMKNTTNNDSGVKDFYTRDEALKFTKKDFDKNPALYKAVEQSMLKWK
jgi:hypothetical protein